MNYRVLVGLALVLTLVACSSVGPGRSGRGMERNSGMMRRHMAPIPEEYAGLANPVPADADSLARGKTVYDANCVACHGEEGRGDGVAAAGLNPAPAPIAQTSKRTSDAYLFYRISEGGDFAPYDSAMPAFKETLDETERWDVISYVRSLP